jgi:hypothetical protein
MSSLRCRSTYLRVEDLYSMVEHFVASLSWAQSTYFGGCSVLVHFVK